MNVGNEGKRSENLDAKKLLRMDKMWNVGNLEVRQSEKLSNF